MNGNQMDTTCFSITNATILDCGSLSIQNLEGVKYFDSLLELYCTFNQLTSLPSLPSTLNTLYCNYNQLPSLSSLPSNLEILNCESNLLTSLPALPSSLLQLTCSSNPISTLPSLPNNLFWLAASYCQLTSLPSLPASLSYLFCSSNQLSVIPSLPSVMHTLAIANNPNVICLPPIQIISGNTDNQFNISATGITCLPNIIEHPNLVSFPNIDNVPVCNSGNNTNNCPLGNFTSIDNIDSKNSTIKIQPNPGNNLVTITSTSATFQLRVIDMQGRIVLSKACNNYMSTIDISDWAAGIYFIEAQGEDQIQRGKLLKQ
jgi:hypothetical protein